ncbi:MAG: hypothetical protein ACOCRK_09260 [bacterium]
MNNGVLGSLSNEDIEFIKDESSTFWRDKFTKKCKGLVVLLDILGWKNIHISKGSRRGIKDILKLDNNNLKPTDLIEITPIDEVVFATNKLRSLAKDIMCRVSNKPNEIIRNIDILNISDSIAIMLDLTCSGSLSYPNLFNLIRKFYNNMLGKGFAIRGTIGYGEYYINSEYGIFMGEAIKDVGENFEATDWAAVTVTDKCVEAIKENNEIDNFAKKIGLIRYKNIPYKKTGANKEGYVIKPFLYEMSCGGERQKMIWEEQYKPIELDKIKKCKNILKEVHDKSFNTEVFMKYCIDSEDDKYKK